MTEKIQTLGSVGRAVLHGQTAPGSGIVRLHVSAVMFTMLILSGFSALRGATVYDSDGSAASVQALHNAAHDGDTITVPPGHLAGLRAWKSQRVLHYKARQLSMALAATIPRSTMRQSLRMTLEEPALGEA